MSSHRETILSRVREALSVPTDHHVRASHPAELAVTSPPKDWLPAVGEDYHARASLFAQWSDKLKTQFQHVADQSQAAGVLNSLADEHSWQKIGVHADPLVEAASGGLSLEKVATDQAYDPQQLESCDAGITACDALIAQTGSVLLTSHSAGGRALSVLPPHHVVIARRDQLIADLPTAYQLLRDRYSENWPSFMTLISGPSRTGDIERILVLGAHGPKKLTVVLVDEDG